MYPQTYPQCTQGKGKWGKWGKMGGNGGKWGKMGRLCSCLAICKRRLSARPAGVLTRSAPLPKYSRTVCGPLAGAPPDDGCARVVCGPLAGPPLDGCAWVGSSLCAFSPGRPCAVLGCLLLHAYHRSPPPRTLPAACTLAPRHPAQFCTHVFEP